MYFNLLNDATIRNVKKQKNFTQSISEPHIMTQDSLFLPPSR